MSRHPARIARDHGLASERVLALVHGGRYRSQSDGFRAVRVDEPVVDRRRDAFGVVGIYLPPHSRQRPGAS